MTHTLTPFGNFLDFYHDVGGNWLWMAIEVASREGVFHSDPLCCIVARPVNSRVPIADLNIFADREPEYQIPRAYEGEETGLPSAHDAWHIIYASGDIRRFFQLATHDLPKLIWQRDNEPLPRIYDYARTKRLIHHGLETSDHDPEASPVR